MTTMTKATYNKKLVANKNNSPSAFLEKMGRVWSGSSWMWLLLWMRLNVDVLSSYDEEIRLLLLLLFILLLTRSVVVSSFPNISSKKRKKRCCSDAMEMKSMIILGTK